MPQELSEMRRSLYQLQARLKELFLDRKNQAEKYQSFAASLQEMEQMTEKYYTPDENGDYPPVSEQELAEIQKQYEKLLSACNAADALLKEEAVASRVDSMASIVEAVRDVAIRDLSALQVVQANDVLSLPELISQARTYTVDIGEGALPENSHVTNLSVPMQYEIDQQQTQGHFVPRGSFVHDNSSLGAIADSLAKKYPNFTVVLDKIRNFDVKRLDPTHPDAVTFYTVNTAMSTSAQYKGEEAMIEEVKQRVEANAKSFAKNENQYKAYVEKVFSEELMNLRARREFEQLGVPGDEIERLFTEYDEINVFFHELGTHMNQLASARRKYMNPEEGLGLSEDSNVDKRDIAVYTVSKLLGKESLVPEAKPLLVLKNGKTVAGTFVEDPSGINPLDIGAHREEVAEYGFENYNNPAAFDDIATLQVLDFICGNVDRNVGNLRLNFDESTKKLVSVKGVGNSFTFGTKVPEDAPSNLGVIGLKTATNILAMTKDSLTFALKGYGLSPQEMEAAWERTMLLQEEIRKGIEHYTGAKDSSLDKGFLRVVGPEEWKNYNLNQLAELGDNQFKVIANMDKLIAEHAKEAKHTKRIIESNSQMNKFLKQEPPAPLKAVPIGNGLEKIDNLGVKLSSPFKLATDVNALPKIAGTKTVRYGLEFDVNGKTQQGFFTPVTVVNERREINRIMDDMISIYPEYEVELERMRQSFLVDPDLLEGIKALYYDINKIPLEGMGISKERAGELRQDKAFGQMLVNINERVNMSQNNLRNYRNFGVDEGASIDQRNVAMTNVATLCGVPELLAKSSNVQMQIGNRLVDGIFMEKAEGFDVLRINPRDPITKFEDSAFENGAGLKSLAELQVLDYLCMNMDRHEGNMLYQFSDDNPPKLMAVVGIDNDFSFGTRDPGKDVSYQVTSIENIDVISERMAKSIGEMNPEMLAQTLRDQKIGNNEILAAQERLARLQTRIKQEKIKIVPDDKWDSYTLNQLVRTSSNNIFARVKNHALKLRDDAKNFAVTHYDPIKYQKVQMVEAFDEKVVEKHEKKQLQLDQSVAKLQKEFEARAKAIKEAEADIKNDMKTMLEGKAVIPLQSGADLLRDTATVTTQVNELLDANDPFYIRSSKQYRLLKQKAKELDTYVKTIQNREENPGIPTVEEKTVLSQKLRELDTKVAEYVNYKVDSVGGREEKFNDLESKRILSVRASGSLVKSVLTICEHNARMENFQRNSSDIMARRRDDATQELENAQGEQLVDAVARRLYYDIVMNVDGLGERRRTALLKETEDAGIKQIKETEAFKQIMSMDHKELVDMANNKLEKSLYQQYLKEMAAHPNKKNVPGGNRPQQQPQVAPQNPDNGPIIPQH
jgi:hypothetical protein